MKSHTLIFLLPFVLAIRASLVLNGDFSNNLMDWEYSGVTIDNQVAQLSSVSPASSFLLQPITLSPLTTFCFKADAKVADSTTALSITFDSRGTVWANEESWETVKHSFTTGETEEYINLKIEISGTGFIDNIQLLQDSDCFLDPEFSNPDQFQFLGQAAFSNSDDFPTPPADIDTNEEEEVPTPDVVLVGDGRVYTETAARFEARVNRMRNGKSTTPGRSFPLGPAESDEKRILIGGDGRTLVANTIPFPARAIAALHRGAGQQHICSGTFVGPRHVLTAAHCLFDRATATWLSPTVVWPGQTGTCGANQNAPHGTFTRFTILIPNGYHTSNPSNSYPHRHDYGMIILPNNANSGCVVGWLGTSSNSNRQEKDRAIFTAGYPGHTLNCAASPCANQACSGFQYMHSCSIKSKGLYDMRYECDTQPGQSGSGVWTVDGPRFVVAIHSGTPNNAVNWGRRITNNLQDWIRDKIQTDYPSTFC